MDEQQQSNHPIYDTPGVPHMYNGKPIYTPPPGTHVPVSEKIFFGMGDFFGAGSAAIVAVLVLAFFTKALGIAASIAGTIILLAKGWDAISDPLMGVISDNTRSRWGRRRPWIFLGGALIYVAVGMLFAPIGTWDMTLRIIFATASYLIYCTISTIGQVPYTSLMSEITPDHKDRTATNTIKLLFSMAGGGICYLLPSIIFEAYIDKHTIDGVGFWLIMTLGLGTAFVITTLCTAIFSKERVPYDITKKEKFSLKYYAQPFMVKTFRLHIIMYLCAYLCMDLISAIVMYYALDVMHGVNLFGSQLSSIYIVAPLMVMAGASTPLIYWLIKKKGKAFAYRAGLPFYIAGVACLAFMPAQDAFAPFIVVCAIVIGLGFGGAQMIPWLAFPDAVDVAELKLGTRNTGAFSGMMTFTRKLSSALAVFLVGIILEHIGHLVPTVEGQYVEQKPELMLTVRILLGVSVAVLISIAIFVSLKYKLNTPKLDRVNRILNEQRKGEPLSEEMEKEKAELLKELG